jgi:dipeptidyl aminopeptidase/acylaminoacyl peptidase
MSRPIQLEDLPKLPAVQGPALSPEGERVAFPVQHWDLERDRYRSEIWLGRFAEPESLHAVTAGRFRDHSPAFSPDGRYLAFVSDRRKEKPADEDPSDDDPPVSHDLWLLDLSGGEAMRLTRLPGSCSDPSWSPDGKRLAFLFQPRDPEPPEVHQRIAHVLESAGEKMPAGLDTTPKKKSEKAPPIVRRVTRLHWREDTKGILPQCREQVWTLDMTALAGETPYDIEAAQLGDQRLRRLTAGPYDHFRPVFSPDGKWLALVANRSPHPDHDPGFIDLWIAPSGSGAPGGGSTEPLALDEAAGGIAELIRVPTPRGPLTAPAWSPDGQHLAYVGHTNPLDLWGLTNWELWTVPVPKAAGGKSQTSGEEAARNLSSSLDRSAEALVITDLGEMAVFSPPVWRQQASEILFHATEGGAVGIYAAPVGGGKLRTVHLEKQAISNLVCDASGRRLAFIATAMTTPPEIWTLQGNDKAQPLSRVAQGWSGDLDLAEPEFLRIPVAEEGHEIEAWLMKPPDFDPARRYPLILQIHGGPAAAYGNALYFEFQKLAASGYCILFANPRGSQGYGFDFGVAIRNDLAAPAHRDLMAAVDVVSQRPYIDEKRMAVTGGSWGGYMTNWIITQTDRFRTAITQRSLCDFESDFGTSDFGYDMEWMLGGPPWTHREAYARCSPLTYVENIKTPLLIIHSEEDWRCPPLQGEMLFMALKMLRREVEMVRFPGEPHGLSRSGTPSRRLARLKVMLEWFAERLSPAQKAASEGETVSSATR